MKSTPIPLSIKLPIEGSMKKIDVSIVRVYERDCWHWDRKLRPLIKKHAKNHPAAKWHWYWLFRSTKIVEKSRGRDVSCWHLALEIQGQNIPIASMLLSEGFPHVADPSKKSVFIWYVCSLPKEVLAAYGSPKCELILHNLVNLAIKRSIDSGFKGRIGLHAMSMPNPTADLKLLKLYRDNCRLDWLDESPIKKLSPFRVSDGRYLYADEVLATALLTSLKW